MKRERTKSNGTTPTTGVAPRLASPRRTIVPSNTAPQRRPRQQQQQQAVKVVKDDEEFFEPWEIVACYHFVLSAVGILTMTCPTTTTTTMCHNDDDNDVNASSSAFTTFNLVSWNCHDGWNKDHLVQAAVLFAVISAAFFRVHGSNPGYLTAERRHWPTTTTTTTTLPHDDNANTNDKQQRYCHTCHIVKPLRAHHCRICQQCVATFDHHCEFVATCIGECNKARFWWLLLVQAVGVGRCGYALLTSTSVFCLFQWSVNTSNDDRLEYGALPWTIKWFMRARVVLAYTVVGLAAAAAFFLLALHTGLALTNITTYECLRGPRGHKFPHASANVLHNLRVYGCFLDWFSGASTTRTWQPIQWQVPSLPSNSPSPLQKPHVQ